jgi:CheY-like chemotaxis protein
MTGSIAGATGANLERASVLVLDVNATSMEITTQILAGFGAKNIQRCESDQAAARIASHIPLDLVIVDASSTALASCDFVRWLRRDPDGRNQFAPVLVITANTQLLRINTARDAGANFVVAKPLTPAMLLQRIQWLARDRRSYVDCASYAGPDRRFRFQGPPPGCDGRRATDLRGDVGAATEPNMSQDDIDALMQPKRIAL